MDAYSVFVLVRLSWSKFFVSIEVAVLQPLPVLPVSPTKTNDARLWNSLRRPFATLGFVIQVLPD